MRRVLGARSPGSESCSTWEAPAPQPARAATYLENRVNSRSCPGLQRPLLAAGEVIGPHPHPHSVPDKFQTN